jgi:hypothetical protein
VETISARSARNGSTSIAAKRTRMVDLSPSLLASDARSRASVLGWAYGGLVEVVLLVLLVFAFPLVILLVGLPIALLIRALIEIAQML